MRARAPAGFFKLAQCRRLPHSSFAVSRTSFRPYSQAARPIPDFAFAFDVDGVLLRSAKPIDGATSALARLQGANVPFILLTNGGGKHEEQRVADLNTVLGAGLPKPLDTRMFVQSHTPFAELANGPLADEYVLVVGGEGGLCRDVALRYGFKKVVTPADIFCDNPETWPFSKPLLSYHKTYARPIPFPLKISAILVFNDPRDWGLDLHIILDVLLSRQGEVGTLSDLNGDRSLPNNGYQQDGQPPLYFSNPDLWWAAAHHLPRLGQGGFRAALEGVWAAVTGGPREGAQLQKSVIGKPFQPTYDFAEKRLMAHRDMLLGKSSAGSPLKRVYMIGDNPESDIRGANTYKSPHGTEWKSVLVKSGVYRGGTPSWEPNVIEESVGPAVEWALKQEKWLDR